MRLVSKVFVIVLVASVLLFGCSKQKNNSSPSILSNIAALKLPISTIAFTTWDSTTPAYQAFRKSRWGQAGSAQILDTAREIAKNGQMPDLERLIEALLKTGLLTSASEQTEVVASAAIFLTTDSGAGAPAMGAYLVASPGNNFKDKLAGLKDLFKSENLEIFAINSERDSFGLNFKRSSGQTIKLYFAASSEVLALSSQEALLDGAFQENQNGLSELAKSPGFSKTVAKLEDPNQIAVSYVDLAKLTTHIKSGLPSTGNETEKKLQAMLEVFPGESFAWVRKFDSTLVDAALLSITPITDEQKRWAELLNIDSTGISAKKLPAQQLVVLAIDGQILRKVRDIALSEMAADSRESIAHILTMLDGLDSLAISVRAAAGASLFPDVALIGLGSNVEALAGGFQCAVNQGLSAANFNLGPWQTKQVDKTDVQYLLSPLGIGAYIAKNSNLAVLSSSESLLKDVITSAVANSSNLQTQLSKGSQSLLSGSNTAVFAHLDFARIAALIENLQGSFAFFTGGKGGLDAAAIQRIKDLGVMSYAISSQSNLIKMQANYEDPQSK